jgi:hypothetical protein
MRVEQLDITPEMAMAMLQGNTSNRKADKKRIAQYAAEMKAGRWKFTTQTIGIGSNGRVVDGQHRLYAIVESEATLPFLVVFEADETTFDVIDTGKVRTGNDIWAIDGKTAPNIAAIARLTYLYTNRRDDAWDSNAGLTSAAVLDWAKTVNATDLLRRAGNKEQIVRKEIKGLGAVVGASLAITELHSGYTVEEVYEEVFEPLVKTLGFEEGQPVYAFHRVLSKRSSASLDNPFCPSSSAHRVNKPRLACILQVIVDVLNGSRRQMYRPAMDTPLPDMAAALQSKPTKELAYANA